MEFRRYYFGLGALALGIMLLYLIIITPSVGLYVQVASALADLFVCGIIIQRTSGLKGGYGLYLLGGRRGIKFINGLAKDKYHIWDAISLWGLSMGFGLSTYLLMRGKIDKRILAIGIISIIAIDLLLISYIDYGLQFLNIPRLGLSNYTPQAIAITPLLLLTLVIASLFGFSGYALFAIFINSASILYSVSLLISNPTPAGVAASGIANQIPGVAPIIPGITLPLAAGVISLAIILIIHEFSHGVLARKAKVKIKQIGILAFGFIPVGGFVEPDEKQVSKLKPIPQTKIFSAGISANFIAMIIFGILTFLVATYVVPGAYHYGLSVAGTTEGYPAYGVISVGSIVTSWNGHQVSNITQLDNAASTDTANAIVTVTTNKGSYAFKALPDPSDPSRGLVGVSMEYVPIINTPYGKIVRFILAVFSISALLNFLIAVVNLLPVPGFDGWRIYRANIKNKTAVNVLGALIIILILLNALPWLF